MKAELIRVERMILRAFGFIVHVEHPHKLVLNHLFVMIKDLQSSEEGPHPLMQDAWNLCNDRWALRALYPAFPRTAQGCAP